MAEKRKRDNPKQSKRFEDAAKNVEAEDSTDALERTLRAIRKSSERNEESEDRD